jgi:hypothetical protein
MAGERLVESTERDGGAYGLRADSTEVGVEAC